MQWQFALSQTPQYLYNQTPVSLPCPTLCVCEPCRVSSNQLTCSPGMNRGCERGEQQKTKQEQTLFEDLRHGYECRKKENLEQYKKSK